MALNFPQKIGGHRNFREIASSPLRSRFRGSLVGAVVGDCLGAVFEDAWTIPQHKKLFGFFEKVDAVKTTKGKSCVVLRKFTDDTAMARSVAASLVEKRSFCAENMAARFQEEYFAEPFRGYGGNVLTVFAALRDQTYQDVYEAASRQFGGQGSYGNGGAMRIAPAALFGYNYDGDEDDLQDLAENITRLTHSHRDAINGAILQCYAVHLALHLDNSQTLNRHKFIDKLISLMSRIEDGGVTASDGSPQRKKVKESKPFTEKLAVVKDYMEKDVSAVDVEENLGNDVSALKSVPAAILSFLRANQACFIERDNPFERTIIFAISLGGDTDTIATMAAAIAGAFYGMEHIPQHWQDQCEGIDTAIKLADQLQAICQKSVK
ncbi:ADP-ribosylhydrolase ARH3-like [Lineus longissimus]|uniref:ADP-ribosylhydrolase ARH3-like n=1 Tax=Lineus longissimus TaxID=88925 RepID=UPI002B4D27A0